ncbi:MAG: hypothetical protein AAGN46_03225 [Acidobacteriota bacterium]
MSTVDRAVREFYASEPLPPSLVEQVQAVSAAAGAERSVRRRWRVAAVVAATVACFALALTLGVGWSQHVTASDRLVERVAREVALNHRKDFAPDVVGSDGPELGRRLAKLPFALPPLDAPTLRGLRPVGGRYCSIEAQIAAQLRLQAASGGAAATLYVTERTPALAALAGRRERVDELDVEFWAERDLIFALARSAPSDASRL